MVQTGNTFHEREEATNIYTHRSRHGISVLLCIVIFIIVISIGYIISWQMKEGSILRGGWSLMQDYSGYNRRPERPDINLCFPGNATVECKIPHETNREKQMQDLSVGDVIRTGMGWSEIYAFMDACPSNATYVQIQCESGHSLTISPHHFLYVTREGTGLPMSLEACKIHLGDLLSVVDNAPATPEPSVRLSKVVQLDIVEAMGYYAPLTLEGTLFVDGVLVSCYASCPNIGTLGLSGADILHGLHAPLRQIYHSHPAISSKEWHTEKGRHVYTEGLRGFGRLVGF